DSSEEDDYMKMTFSDAPTTSQPETSLQRRQRERREAEIRGRPKSKAELAAEADARREAALSTSLLSDPSAAKKSKGFAMMAKMGFTPGSALGSTTTTSNGRTTEPIKISVKDGREGIGLESERKRKLREAAEEAGQQAKRAKADEGEYRERVRREREEARLGRLVYAAQKVAEMMDEEKTARKSGGGSTEKSAAPSSRPLRSIPVVYRGLVRSREEAERDRRMRYDLEQSLSRLPTYEDDDEDEDDKRALGKGSLTTTTTTAATAYVTAEDLDDEDEELDAFNALEPAERLHRLVAYLRSEHRYCFWCKFAYPDAEMDGCPGLEEEDHD
ncbi:hypothetical protein B0T17DRAFT_457194, partial [Bombardia bombarda]